MHLDRSPAARTSSSRTLTSLAATLATALAAAAFTAGCGNTYRPVVASINPVGPAGQPAKYAVAISSVPPSSPGLVTLIDFSGDTIVNTTLIGLNPYYFILYNGGTGYTLNGDGTLNTFSISTSLLSSEVDQSTLLPNTQALSILPGTSLYIAEAGRNATAQLEGYPPSVLQELPTGAGSTFVVGVPNAPRVFSLVQGSPATAPGTAVTIETGSNTIDARLPVGINPTYGVMTADDRRAFILNKGSNTVTVINSQTNALDQFVTGSFTGTTTVGSPALTAVSSIAGLTAGELISGNGIPTGTTIVSAAGTTVVLSASATAAGAGVTVSTLSSTIPVGVAPIWADFAPTLNELIVANAGNGTTAGSVTIISIPLCNQTSVVTNPNCDANNPLDAVGFGSVIANIPVGINPVMVGVLQDGTQAYVANAGNAAKGIAGSVSVINLTTDTLTATIPGANSVTATDNFVHGHPTYIGVTTGTPTGKVYVVSSDSTDISIIRTDTNQLQTHLPLQGNGISVRMTSP